MQQVSAQRRFLPERLSFTDLIMWVVGGLLLIVIVVGTVSTLNSGKYTGRQWFDLVIGGLARGGIYALIALGYTLVYGILRMINFAHSEVFMAGPYTAYFVAAGLADALGNQNLLVAVPALLLVVVVSMAVSTLIAVALERIAYRPLRNAPRLVPLITAIGASYFLQNAFRGFYGSGVQAYPTVQFLVTGRDWPLPITKIQILVIVAAFIFMAALYYIVQRTKTGKAMRAVSEDKAVAALMGIDVDNVIVRTFILGGALAGAAGVLFALMFGQVKFDMGFFPGIKAFTAAVLGGIGNIPGAMVGALFLGLVESVGPNLFLDGLGIRAPNQLQDVIAFTMLVMVLIFRPTGILGERLAVKKA
jgi:branched-chain amino acid transport system permease protein